MTPKSTLSALAILAGTVSPMAASAEVEAGLLTCHQVGQSNYILYSQADFDCSFDHADGSVEKFEGTIRRVGVDLSTSNKEALVWYVFSPSTGVAPGALEGGYFGASADASVGVGVGVRGLVGGFDRAFTLQPASVSGAIGVGAAAGVETLQLRHEG